MGPIAIAMTTAPRRVPTLPIAIASLRAAGWHEPLHLFAEPEAPLDGLDACTIVHANPTVQGCFGNWRQALQHLVSDRTADWLLVVQDDAIWAPNAAAILRAELETRQDQRLGFLSPYVVAKDVPRGAATGWNELRAGLQFWGALAICMPREAADDLMTHSRFARHAAPQQVDAVVAGSMLDLRRPSFVHVPSLVDHVGETSTLGHSLAHNRGYGFDRPAAC